MEPDPRRLIIELDPYAEPLSGQVDLGRGQSVRFTGWSELTTVIDAAHRGALAPPTREGSALPGSD
jgi:hypothetical protein